MLVEASKCTGCGACAAVCPKNCIQMHPDSEGFRQPVVDTEKCIHCNRCASVCPVMNPPVKQPEAKVYATKNKDDAVRQESSSGGVFTALAEYVLESGGAVCAAAYDNNFSVVHDFAHSKGDLGRFRGAKYAQSQADHCFPEIKRLLAAEKKVLFVGTPCQTAALHSYLKDECNNLLLVDMVCHGVPSPKVWKRYVDELSAEAPVEKINLRSKATGWSHYGYCVDITQQGRVAHMPQGQNWFMRGFVSNLYLRHSCENCPFKGSSRCSDITLGDFWGIWDLAPNFDDNKGTSLLMLHTPKGHAAWEGIKSSFDVLLMTMADGVKHNPSAEKGSAPHPHRDIFFKELDSCESLCGLIQKQLAPLEEPPTIIRRILRKLKRKG